MVAGVATGAIDSLLDVDQSAVAGGTMVGLHAHRDVAQVRDKASGPDGRAVSVADRHVADSGAVFVGDANVSSISRHTKGFQLLTSRGKVSADTVLLATNGYTGKRPVPALRRRLLPVGSYAIVTEPLPGELFDRLRDHGVGIPGQRVVDLGTGTGTVARQLAARGCEVTGIDPDTRLMAEAARLGEAEGVTVEYREATAEHTGLAGHSFDVVTAGQCWHWFDRPAAVAECRQLLRPGSGRLVIAHLDWIPLPGNVVEATERLIESHNPAWTMGGRHGMWPQWIPDVHAGGFEAIETFSFDLDIPYTHDAWRGRIRASAGITVLDDEQRRRFDAALADLLDRSFAADTLSIPHRVWAMVAAAPS